MENIRRFIEYSFLVAYEGSTRESVTCITEGRAGYRFIAYTVFEPTDEASSRKGILVEELPKAGR
jgi:hypothetical protein